MTQAGKRMLAKAFQLAMSVLLFAQLACLGDDTEGVTTDEKNSFLVKWEMPVYLERLTRTIV